jgi:hypothetical protein
MENIKIIDDAVDYVQYSQLANYITGPEFKWEYASRIVRETSDLVSEPPPEKYNQQMCRVLYYNPHIQTEDWRCLDSVFRVVKPLLLIKVKVNLTFGTDNPVRTGWHTDSGPGIMEHSTTAIWYVNSNNGGTLFKDEENDTEFFVESVANRLVIFPAHIKHMGVTCTDERARFVVNINYMGENPLAGQD